MQKQVHKMFKDLLYPRNYRSRFLVGRLEDAKIEHLVHWPKFEGSSTSLGKQFCKLFFTAFDYATKNTLQV